MESRVIFNFRPTECVPLTHGTEYSVVSIIKIRSYNYYVLKDNDGGETPIIEKFIKTLK
jgi:hypothetical protein